MKKPSPETKKEKKVLCKSSKKKEKKQQCNRKTIKKKLRRNQKTGERKAIPNSANAPSQKKNPCAWAKIQNPAKPNSTEASIKTSLNKSRNITKNHNQNAGLWAIY